MSHESMPEQDNAGPDFGASRRFARERYESFRAPDREQCECCPAYPETRVYNRVESMWVCAECDLALNEAFREGAAAEALRWQQIEALVSAPEVRKAA